MPVSDHQGQSLRRLQIFLAVVDEGGASAAAKRLSISQPGVTKSIQALEEQMGTALFRRIGRRMVLTNAGERVERAARKAVLETTRLLSSVVHAVGDDIAPLRVGFTAPQLALKAARRFRDQVPNVPLEFFASNTATLFGMLDDFKLDIIIIGTSAVEGDYEYRLFAKQTLCFLTRRGSPLAQSQSISLARVAELPIILREQGSYTRDVFLENCEIAGLAPKIEMEMFSREAVAEAVAEGFGNSVVLQKEAPRDPRLISLPILDLTDVANEYLVCLKSALSYAPVGDFLRISQSAASE